MTSESKILTVSYGTFSCTLEGFDDPFNTMKAIAEYFRDLTAEDRYFGAEPPQPDAAMLHRIAEREVSRLVDARVRENGVHLRPQDGTDAAAAKAPSPAAPMPAAEMAPTPAPAEPSVQDAIPDGVAAKLARVRQSVTIEPVALAVEETFEATVAALDDVTTAPATDAAPSQDPDRFSSDALRQLEALLRAPAETPEETPAEEVAADVAADVAAETPEDIALVADAQDWPDAAVTEVETAGAIDTVDEVAADALAPIEPVAEAPLPEDLPPENLFAEDLAEDDLAPEDLSADLAERASDDLVAEAVAPVLDPALDNALLDAAAVEDALEDRVDEDRVEENRVEADQPAVALADLQPEDAPDLPASLTEALRDDPLPEAAAPVEDEAAVAVLQPVEPPPTNTSRLTGRSKRVNSRVVRLRPDADEDQRPSAPRQNPGMAPIGSDDAEVARLLRQTDNELADDENRRRLDSIAHLKAAVLATEADRAFSGDVKPAADTQSDSYRNDLAQVVQPDDVAPAAAEAPPTPEVKPRRKTVSVRPQEPRPGTIRPGMMGPPPLVLVSEQRIDRIQTKPAPAPTPTPAPAAATAVPDVAAPAPAPMPAAPMPATPATAAPREGQPLVALRTGRLTGAIGIGAAAPSPLLPQKKIVLDQPSQSTASDLDDEEDLDEHLSATEEAGLAEFAERVGVKSMAEMLEAAAAYATCIEKRSQFTRPQLMRRLMASAGSRQVSREDGLRSFGTLLRTGRIEKVSRGHYMLAETSPYLAEARRLS